MLRQCGLHLIVANVKSILIENKKRTAAVLQYILVNIVFVYLHFFFTYQRVTYNKPFSPPLLIIVLCFSCTEVVGVDVLK